MEKNYRPCVGICLLNKDNLIFTGERLNKPGAWQMPQGGIDAGEDVRIAAFRELKEEIGTDKMEIIALHPEKLRYDLPPDLNGKLWSGKYQGQEQQWVYARFTGVDSDIQLDADDHPEFGQWAWLPPEEIMARMVEFKIKTYQRVFAYLQSLRP